MVVENDGSRAAAEAVSVTPSKTYQFSKTGIHTVYIKFEGCTTLERITSLAMTAPTIGKNTFYSIKSGGILYVPQSATGYDTWIQTGNTNNYEYYLGNYNWTKQEITE